MVYYYSPFAVWVVTFVTYVVLQLWLTPARLNYRRHVYLISVIFLTKYSLEWISEKITGTIIENFTIYGPSVLTAAAMLMSFLVGPTDNNNQGEQQMDIDRMAVAMWGL